jgi:hypothetical protein
MAWISLLLTISSGLTEIGGKMNGVTLGGSVASNFARGSASR